MPSASPTTLTPSLSHSRNESERREERTCDGIICFGGEDWWYHNRGHYDMQMMRELSGCAAQVNKSTSPQVNSASRLRSPRLAGDSGETQDSGLTPQDSGLKPQDFLPPQASGGLPCVPVLYVNSIGMRMPRVREGGMFFRRIARKLRSIRRGLVKVRPGFSVLSPVTLPGRPGAIARRTLLPMQVRGAARRLGIHRPLVWVACPPAVDAIRALNPRCVVYQRTDRFECFHGVNSQAIAQYDRALKREADLTLFCSGSLYEQEREQCREAIYVDHGVDYERFASAGEATGDEPEDIAPLPRPRIGFVGGIDIHTFDPVLFAEVARALPEMRFVLVGGCSLAPTERPWRDLANVTMLGQKPYESVPRYMAACDVLIMPWNRNEWIEACNPVKLKEYLAVGRPVVSTPFGELRRYEGLVRVAKDAPSFATAIRAALDDSGDIERGRARVAGETWQAKAAMVVEALARRGLVLSPRH